LGTNKDWEVEFYRREDGSIPVEELQASPPAKHQAKSIGDVRLLEEFGTALRAPHVKSVRGQRYRGLWELRTQFASDISRIFYFLAIGRRFVLLHGYVKKSDKLDAREVETALRYMLDYLRRHTDEQS
jgi:phage-related protein